MVAEQLRPHGVTDERVLQAMASVPREEFLSARMRRHAYEDRALAIECGQTISQPLVVALMIQVAAPKPDDVALEVGTGSGYEAAVGDGSLGWPAGAPYNLILVAAAARGVPPALVEQLADDGRMVIPVSTSIEEPQDLRVYERRDGEVSYRSLFPVLFVPLRTG